MLNKSELRRVLLQARAAITPDLRLQWDKEIQSRLLAWLKNHPVQSLGIYWPIRSEPDLQSAYIELAMQGMRLALPIITNDHAPLEFAAWNPGEILSKDKFGIAIPVIHNKVQPDAILIPCVGFNAQHIRLGYGGGFYDRTLALMPRPMTIGIAYACTLAAFEGEDHDIALDIMITNAV